MTHVETGHVGMKTAVESGILMLEERQGLWEALESWEVRQTFPEHPRDPAMLILWSQQAFDL